MNVMKILFAAIAVLLILAVGFYGYLGGFKKVEIDRGTFGPAEIIFSTHRGPYSEIGKSWTEFQNEWEAAGLAECDALAAFLDPPGTPDDALRSILACRIGALPQAERIGLKEKFANAALPQSEAFTSSFPYKNYASFMLAPRKVYPELKTRIEAEGIDPLLAFEIYGVMGEAAEINFAMPIGVERSAYQSLFDAF